MHRELRKRTVATVWVVLTLAGLGAAGAVHAAGADTPGPRTPGVWSGR